MKANFQRGNSQAGLSLVESAAVLLILLTILFSAFGVVDFIYLKIRIADQVDKFIADQGIRPFQLNSDGSLTLDDSAIQAAITGVSEAFEHDFQQRFGATPDQYFLEIDYATVDIDSATGITRNVIQAPGTVRTMGNLSVPHEILERTDLLHEFEIVAGPIGERNTFAVPTALYGRPGVPQYAPGVLLLGVRAAYSFDGSLADWVVSTLNFSQYPIVSDFKVIPVRGEVEAPL